MEETDQIVSCTFAGIDIFVATHLSAWGVVLYAAWYHGGDALQLASATAVPQCDSPTLYGDAGAQKGLLHTLNFLATGFKRE